MNREVYNLILIHTARTWERIRTSQPYQEMPFDNLASVEEIEHIASEIYHNDIIQGFVKEHPCTSVDNYWELKTDEGMSDAYIENQAKAIIIDEYELS